MPNHYMNTYMVNGERRVIEWPTDVAERYCVRGADGSDGTGLVINPDSQMCNVHWPPAEEGQVCEAGERNPTTCLHPTERLDPGVSPLVPRCLECGLEGVDVTAQWAPRTALVEQAPGDTTAPIVEADPS